MKPRLFLLTALLGFTVSANGADIDPVQVTTDTKITEVLNRANDVTLIKTVNAGDYSYKLVMMDSALSGDILQTTVVLVGEGGVGSEAGYDNAFLLANSTSSDIKADGDSVLITQKDSLSNLSVTGRYHYDSKSGKLIQTRK